MGTTPTYSWPYPESTDPVANGAQDIEDLALAVETTVSGITGGKILQVVQTVAQTQFSTTSTSFVDITGLSVTITPTSATSKILIHASVMGEKSDTNLLYFNLYRGGAASGTSLGDGTSGFGYIRVNDPPIRAFLTAQYLDSPATTSATTYTAAAKVNAGTGVYMKDNTTATITLMEVSA